MKPRFSLLHVLTLLAFAPYGALGQPAVLVVDRAPSEPVTAGQPVSMSVSAPGAMLRYQWKLDGANIPAATNSSYTLPMVGVADRGAYEVIVAGDGGTTSIAMGSLAVASSDARLVNLSARGMVGTGSDVMIAGFVSSGFDDSTNMNVLFRGMGPALAGMMSGSGMGMSTGVLASPVLTIYDSLSSPMGSNMGWTNAPTQAGGSGASHVPAEMRSATQGMMNAVGAFTMGMGPADSALMMKGPRGAYTAIMSGANNTTGIGLIECYDADTALGNAANTARIVNMSVRGNITDTNTLIAGFVMNSGPSGSPGTVMLRAMGPALTSMGVSGAMPRPTMTLYDSNSRPIASNSGWGNGPMIATGSDASPTRAGMAPAMMNVMARLGAFSPVPGSADSAMVATLPAGAYTVVVSGQPDSAGRPMTGVVLCEIYEVR